MNPFVLRLEKHAGPEYAQLMGMAATVWQGRISFGLVAIPVRLYKAARRERTKFHQVYRPGDRPVQRGPAPAPGRPHLVIPTRTDEEATLPPSTHAATHEMGPAIPEPGPVMRVHQQPVSGQEDRPVVERSQILKGYELEKDRYAVFEAAELAALRPSTSTELEIVEFVRLNEIDPIFFDTSYYVAPDRGGEKAYAVLFGALKESSYVALGTFAMHGREHVTVIRPGSSGLILHTIFFANEVRSSDEYRTDPRAASAKELELAKMLIDATAASFDPAKLKDTFEERVRALIASRAGAAVALQPTPERPPATPAPDIMEVLRRSLEAIRQPPKRESRGQADRGKRRVRRRNG